MSATLALRIKVLEQQKATGEIRQFAGSLNLVTNASRGTQQGLRGTASAAQMVGAQARQARALEGSIHDVGRAAGSTERGVRKLASSVSDIRELASGFKETARAATEAGRAASKVFEIVRAMRGGGPIALFNAAAPDALRKRVGLGLMAGGVAQTAYLGHAVHAAGQIQGVEGALRTNLKGSGITVEEMMEELKQFDADSQLDFLESSKTANRLVAKGFDPKDVIPIMRTIGDVVGSQMGTQDDFEGIARALAQIKARGGGQYSSEEGNQLSERGVNANRMISEATGVSEADIQSGNHKITGDQALKAILEGMEKFKGGMESAAQTLPGQMATLQGGIFQLHASIGKYLVPGVTMAVRAVTYLVDRFNKLPAPIHAVLGYAMAFNAGVLVLIGTLITLAGPIGTMIFMWKVLNFTIPLVNKSIGSLVWSLLKQLIPSIGAVTLSASTMMMALGAMALAVITVAAIIKGIEWWNDAKTKSDGEMANEGPVEGAIAYVGRQLGDNSAVVTDTDRKLYDLYKKSETKKGKPVDSFEVWFKRNSTESDEMSGDTPEQVRAEKEKQEKAKMMGQHGSQIAKLQSGNIAMPGMTPSILAGSQISSLTKEKAALRASIEEERNALDIKEAEADERFATRLASLEAQRNAARDDRNAAKEAQLEFEIDKLQAERDYALAKIRADGVALEDEKKADAMMRIAETKRKGALQRAQIAFNAAKNKKEKGSGKSFKGGILPGLPGGLQTLVAAGSGNAGGMFNPYENAQYGDGEEPFTRMLGAPQRPDNMTSLSRNISAKTREWVARAKAEIQQAGNGKRVLKLLVDDVPLDDEYQAIGSRIP